MHKNIEHNKYVKNNNMCTPNTDLLDELLQLLLLKTLQINVIL